MGFVPVNLPDTDSTTPEPNRREPLHLPPAARPVDPSQPRQLRERSPDGNRLDLPDLAQNLKLRFVSLPLSTRLESGRLANDLRDRLGGSGANREVSSRIASELRQRIHELLEA